MKFSSIAFFATGALAVGPAIARRDISQVGNDVTALTSRSDHQNHADSSVAGVNVVRSTDLNAGSNHVARLGCVLAAAVAVVAF